MKYLDLFTGYGGFTLGINQAFNELQTLETQPQNSTDNQSESPQHRQRPLCIGFSEIDKYAISVYQKYFPEKICELHTQQQPISEKPESEERPQGGVGASDQQREVLRSPNGSTSLCNCRHKNYGDITKINPDTLPDFDLLTGGFPCQAFSIAGKRKGFDDTRGTLFFDIARILKVKRPRNFLLENVKGLLSHDNGRTFKTIITTLTELGYCVEWQVLNAKDFGVPQNRERVFIVGHFGGVPERKVFPIVGHDQKDIRSEREADKPLTPTMLGEHRTELGKKTRREIRKNEGRDSTLRGKDHKEFRPNSHQLANCITTGKENIEKWLIDNQIKIRRLTPMECERLMGLPDGWTQYGNFPCRNQRTCQADQRGVCRENEELSDTQRYKLCGNGVVVNCVREVIKRLYQ